MDDLDQGMRAEISSDGRIDLPREYLRSIGLDDGGTVLVTAENGEIRIRAIETMLHRLQELGRKAFAGSGYTVDRFIADRRADWGE
jgi:bifunctional DNA-binding transcriptional regulator/antitoxin component of YhaV-PrlF toxin-antitoxin module